MINRYLMAKSLRWFEVNVFVLIAIISVIFLSLFNLPVWLHITEIIHGLDNVSIGFVISLPFFLIAVLNFIFTPFSFRFILKPFFVFLFLSSSLVTYTTMKYGLVFDQSMIQNIVETNFSEASSYFNLHIFLWFCLTGLLPSVLLVFLRIEYPCTCFRGAIYRLASMIVSLFIILIIAFFFYKDYASVGRNNPTLNKEIIPANYIYSTVKYAKTLLSDKAVFREVGLDAVRKNKNDKPVLMFFVIGETARSENFSLNGYVRETNSFTSKIDGVISFSDVFSCGTSTAVSVPCMFSDMSREQFDSRQAANSENVLDILKRTGVNILWIENDGGCKGVCKRLSVIDVKPSENRILCNGKTCYDEILLESVDEKLKENRGDMFFAFHMIGSHGPTYYLRYPGEHRHFSPDCSRSDIENCSQEQLVNTYDNTIRYTDYVLSKMIRKLTEYNEQYNTVLLYVSDHGESLGEKGLYLHGTPYKFAPEQQIRVPLILWMSTDFIESKNINSQCLAENAIRNKYSHDNIFSTLLGVWDVSTSVYDKEADIFYPCRQ